MGRERNGVFFAAGSSGPRGAHQTASASEAAAGPMPVDAAALVHILADVSSAAVVVPSMPLASNAPMKPAATPAGNSQMAQSNSAPSGLIAGAAISSVVDRVFLKLGGDVPLHALATEP